MLQEIKELIEKEIHAISNIPIDDSIIKAVELIFNQTNILGGKVVVSGVGKAGQIGINIATTLSSTGTPSVFIHPCEAQHGDLGILQKNDVLLLISNSGKTTEIVALERLARNFINDIKIICLTGVKNSPLAQISDIVLHTGDPKEICPLGLTPTTSTTVMTVLGDIIVVNLMKKRNFSKEDYAKRHHGGYLGIKARENE